MHFSRQVFALVAVLFLLLGILFRLSYFREVQSKAMKLCTRLEENPRIELEGELIADEENTVLKNTNIEIPVRFPKDVFKGLGRFNVKLTGIAFCKSNFQNKRQSENPFLSLEMPTLIVKARGLRLQIISQSGWLHRSHGAFVNFIKLNLAGLPHLQNVVLASWTGRMDGFSEPLKDFYKEGGLLQIIALSGQHVAILVFWISLLLRAIAGFIYQRDKNLIWLLIPKKLHVFLPTFLSLLLLFTSLGNPSVLRTFAMAFCCLLLNIRGLRSAAIQVVAFSAAMLLIWDPTLVLNLSFFLSVGCTYLLCRVSSELETANQIKTYLALSVGLPFFVVPLTAHFFAKVSLLAPVTNILIAWFWELFLIPLSFALPLLFLFFSKFTIFSSALTVLNKICQFFFDAHTPFYNIVKKTYVSTFLPNFWEWILIEVILFMTFSKIFRRFL